MKIPRTFSLGYVENPTLARRLFRRAAIALTAFLTATIAERFLVG